MQGHTWSEIKSYTHTELLFFLDAAQRLRNISIVDTAIAGRAAQATSEAFKTWADGLTHGKKTS